MRGALLLAAACACLAAAPSPKKPGFDALARAARAEARANWRKDACLAAAHYERNPGWEHPAEGHRAGGERYEFYFYSKTSSTESYRYLSAYMPVEKGTVDPVDTGLEQGAGPVGNAPRCLDGAITLSQAISLARKAGLSFKPDMSLYADRDKLVEAELVKGRRAWHKNSSIPRGREVWIVVSRPWDMKAGGSGKASSMVVLDAATGAVLKRYKAAK